MKVEIDMALSVKAAQESMEIQSIDIHFQPIVSIVNHSVVGVEALCRPVTPDGTISPLQLFFAASKAGVTVELDRLCRYKALKEFTSVNHDMAELMLFINFDVSIIDQGVVGSGNFIQSVRKLGLDPRRIVIEILEDRVNNTDALLRFVDSYHSLGFSIALDDVGTGYSNIERISLIKPDVIKIDQSIIRNIDHKFYNQEILKSLVGLSHKLGSIVIAEGIENLQEVMVCLDAGVDLVQGYYFGCPQELNKMCTTFNTQCLEAAAEFKKYKLQKMNREQLKQKEFMELLKKVAELLTGLSIEDMKASLGAIVKSYPLVECGYLLDSHGVQVSETVFNEPKSINTAKQIFHPATPGQNHSTKEYYYFLIESGLPNYITEPYISWASGSLCVTASQKIEDDCQRDLLLCIDILYQTL